MRCPWLIAALACLVGSSWPCSVQARSDKTVPHRYSEVWSSAIRFIRADRSYPIKEKDRDNGFILFVYPGTGAVKECAASLELFEITDDLGHQRIRLQLTIEHQPSYVEAHLLDSLEQKLRDEHGTPPPRPAPKPPAKDPPAKDPPKK